MNPFVLAKSAKNALSKVEINFNRLAGRAPIDVSQPGAATEAVVRIIKIVGSPRWSSAPVWSLWSFDPQRHWCGKVLGF